MTEDSNSELHTSSTFSCHIRVWIIANFDFSYKDTQVNLFPQSTRSFTKKQEEADDDDENAKIWSMRTMRYIYGPACYLMVS